ncbi:hypothetical protein DFH28DRAFT_1033132 [Melampsora americana]|nr:hypothetical protein DFH28DRAFT_1033132 [Melampsora americana]
MKKLLSTVILGLNLSQSIVICGPGELNHGDTFLAPEMVNSFSFVPEHPSNDVIGTVSQSNILQSSTKITPYAAFFRQTKEVADRTQSQEIKELAVKVDSMISTLNPTFESWGNWLERNQDTVNQVINLAYEAFDSDHGCDEIERTWIVGILSAISKYMPPDEKKLTMEEKIGKIPWTNQVILEIQATKAFEPFMTKRFESLLLKNERISANEINKDLEELLARSNMLGMFDKLKEEKIPCQVTKIYDLISKHLLKSKLPEDENKILKLLYDLKDFFKHTDISEWEGRYCEAILQHTLNYSSQIRKIFSNLLQDFNFFRQIHFPFAKKDMIEYLKEEPKMNDLKGFMNNIKSWEADQTLHAVGPDGQVILDTFYDLMDPERSNQNFLHHYKFLAAFYLIFPHRGNDLLERSDWLAAELMNMWFTLYPEGIIPHANFGTYEWMPVIKNPSYLQNTLMYLAANKMNHSEEKSIVELGISLDTWPDDSTGVSASQHYQKIFNTLSVFQNTEASDEVYERSLEFIYHLVSVKNGCASEFVHMMKTSIEFRKMIQQAAKKVRKMKKIPHRVDRNLPVAISGFHKFLQIAGDMFKNDQLDQTQQDVMIEQVVEKLKKPPDFHLIVGGQPFKFHFNEPSELDANEGKKRVSLSWS